MKNLFKHINSRTTLLAILTFLLGWQLGHRDVQVRWTNYKPTVSIINKEPPQEVNIDFKLFWDTWDLVSRSYIDKKALDPHKLFYGAISGMVSAIGDPYTVFLPPEQQKSSKEELNGSFEGVGLELGFNKEKRLVVVTPLDGTPADKAGIRSQDVILEINEKDATNMTIPEAVKLIRGPRGTEVALLIMREGEDEPKSYKLVRDTIIVKSVELSFKQTPSGKNIAAIKLSRFAERTKEEWEQAVEEILSKNPDGVILDVRNNPGGFLEGAVFIASEFLEGGNVVLQENNQGERIAFKVNRLGRLTKIPLQVLINKGSASASEIVAGALQDRKRAKLIGEKSFGKGTIQEAQDLEGGTGIHITVAKWLTPNGKWVNETNGLDPDFKVESDEQSSSASQSKEDSTTRPSDGSKNPQLNKALELFD